MASNKKSKVTSSNLAVNRKATHDYIVLEKYEAGIELVGTEVKVLRNGEGGLMGAWCKADESNQLWLMQVRIPPYALAIASITNPYVRVDS
jgi:SsrA-binding protein